MNKYSEQIEKALWSYENYKPYHPHSIEWICNRIEWCWKWKKISQKQMENFADRIVKIMDEERYA